MSEPRADSQAFAAAPVRGWRAFVGAMRLAGCIRLFHRARPHVCVARDPRRGNRRREGKAYVTRAAAFRSVNGVPVHVRGLVRSVERRSAVEEARSGDGDPASSGDGPRAARWIVALTDGAAGAARAKCEDLRGAGGPACTAISTPAGEAMLLQALEEDIAVALAGLEPVGARARGPGMRGRERGVHLCRR